MIELRIYTTEQDREPFTDWLADLKDIRARAIVRARLAKLQGGNFGDCKALREGVQELRIDYGPGYRVYLSKQGSVVVLLLCGSDKRDQDRTIKQAIDYLTDWKQRGKP
jgi:putative addiction module killer protein